MFYILQNNLFDEKGFETLIDVLNRFSLPYSIHKCIPFVGILEPEPQPTQNKVFVFGSYTLALEAVKRGWKPGVFLDDNLDYKKQLEYWQNNMFNDDAEFCNFVDVKEQIQPFFIRPVKDTKIFSGYTTDWIEFGEFRERELRQGKKFPDDKRSFVQPDTEVMICKKKPIYAEYRTWVIDQKVVAWSQYKIGTMAHYKEDVDPRIIQFANDRAKEWSPAPAYCLDVFDTPDNLKIGEVNNINAAGFYAANMGKLVIALEEAFG